MNSGSTERKRGVGEGFTTFGREELQRRKKSLTNARFQLPIARARKKLRRTVERNSSLVIVGPTGSGKTTQVPQYLLQWGVAKSIAITQLRRIAATSVARRVASEMGVNLGSTVGYHVRFDNTTQERTQITYVTDGMLIRECMVNPELCQYDTIILDEAHERSLFTDVLFALLKQIQKKRKKRKLKVIAMSATLDTRQFSEYLGPAFIVRGRLHPVNVLYLQRAEKNYLDATFIAILQTHIDAPFPGDILVFLTGKDEIDTLARMVASKASALPPNKAKFEAVPIYSALPMHLQRKVFQSMPGVRKIVLATNIAETSLTIPNIKYVIDSGKVKRKFHEPQTGMDIFKVVNISRSEAWQRSGRAGRDAPGHALRLYTEKQFESFDERVDPEIMRSHLSSVILQLKVVNIDLPKLELMDKPSKSQIAQSQAELIMLQALTAEKHLTDMGRKMAVFPLPPVYSRVVMASKHFGCTKEVLMIVAMLCVDNVLYTPSGESRNKSIVAHRTFIDDDMKGDHIVLLRVLQSFLQNNKSQEWCKTKYLNHRALLKATRVWEQLATLYVDNVDTDIGSAFDRWDAAKAYEMLVKCLLEGMFLNIARAEVSENGRLEGYRTDKGVQVHIHPSSTLFQEKPECILYNTMIESKHHVWVRDCLEIVNVDWANDLFSWIDP